MAEISQALTGLGGIKFALNPTLLGGVGLAFGLASIAFGGFFGSRPERKQATAAIRFGEVRRGEGGPRISFSNTGSAQLGKDNAAFGQTVFEGIQQGIKDKGLDPNFNFGINLKFLTTDGQLQHVLGTFTNNFFGAEVGPGLTFGGRKNKGESIDQFGNRVIDKFLEQIENPSASLDKFVFSGPEKRSAELFRGQQRKKAGALFSGTPSLGPFEAGTLSTFIVPGSQNKLFSQGPEFKQPDKRTATERFRRTPAEKTGSSLLATFKAASTNVSGGTTIATQPGGTTQALSLGGASAINKKRRLRTFLTGGGDLLKGVSQKTLLSA